MSLCTRRAMLQPCDIFFVMLSLSLFILSLLYIDSIFTLYLCYVYHCLFALLSVLDFIFSYDSSSFITCLLSFHMLLTFYHMCTIFHMLTVITCLPFITCYFIYLDYKYPLQYVDLSLILTVNLSHYRPSSLDDLSDNILPFSLRLVPDFLRGTHGACQP